MQVELLNGGWIKRGSVIAFPYSWQRPAKTEEWVYDTLTEAQVNSKFVEFICFPWATLIDAMDRGKMDRLNELMQAINELPPKKSLIRATACQHIGLKKISNLLKKIRVSNIFWAHKNKKDILMDGISLHPMALYPVAFFSEGECPSKSFKERKYRFSFIGAYSQSNYINNDRLKIFELVDLKNSFILKRNEWHFERQVYKEDINSISLSKEEKNIQIENMSQYKEIMNETQFALCPSGAGPNTIRLWEAFMFQSVPVIMNSTLDFPDARFENRCVSLISVTHEEINKIYQESVMPFVVSLDELLSNVMLIFDNEYLTKLFKIKKG
jgi:hypothetical protein